MVKRLLETGSTHLSLSSFHQLAVTGPSLPASVEPKAEVAFQILGPPIAGVKGFWQKFANVDEGAEGIFLEPLCLPRCWSEQTHHSERLKIQIRRVISQLRLPELGWLKQQKFLLHISRSWMSLSRCWNLRSTSSLSRLVPSEGSEGKYVQFSPSF